MASIDFPNNPQINDIHIHEDVSWSWDGVSWKRLFEDYNFSSKIGIGTSSPQEEIHIKSVTPVIRIEDIDGGYMQIVGNDGSIRFDADNTNSIADTNVRFIIDGSEKFRIDSDGKVGIVNENPNYELTIGGNDTSSSIQILSSTTGTGPTNGLRIWNTGLSSSLWNYDNTPTLFGTNNLERMRIDSSGNVDIGNSSSNVELKVNNHKVYHEGNLEIDTAIVFSTSMENTPTEKWVSFKIDHISGSDTSKYYYFDVYGYSDNQVMDSQLHYRLYIHVRSDGNNVNLINIKPLLIMDDPLGGDASEERFNFYYTQTSVTDSKVWIHLPEDYSGLDILSSKLESGSLNQAISSMFSETTVQPSGLISVPVIESLRTEGGSDPKTYIRGKVGIGTATPSRPLHVMDGTNDGSGGVKVSSYLPVIELQDMSTDAGSSKIQQDQLDMKIGPIDSNTYLSLNTQDTLRLRIDKDGNVGIGEGSPEARLHVKKTDIGTKYVDDYSTMVIEDTEARLQLCATDAGTNAAAITLSNGANHWTMHHRGPSTTGYLAFGHVNTTTTSDIVQAAMANTPPLSIHTDGNVGIGTTAPSYKLHVNGTSYFENGFHFHGNETSQTEKHATGDINTILLKDTTVWAYPYNTTKSGAKTLTFTAPNIALDGTRYYLKFLHTDAESGSTGGLRWTINDADETPLHYNDVPGSQDDNSFTWSTFDITDHVVTGTNTLYFWSSTGDGGSQQQTHVFTAVGLALPNEPVELQQHFYKGLTTDGKVGIGTSSPSAKLSISDAATVSTDPTDATHATISLEYTSTKVLNIGDYSTTPFASYIQSANTSGDPFSLALNPSGGNVGIGTTSPSAKLHISTPAYDVNNIVPTLSAGYNTSATGHSSIAMGYSTTASGNYSTAMGFYTTASGSSSTAMGIYSIASGTRSTAMGYGAKAFGSYSTAMGFYTEANGYSSTAMGTKINVDGNYSFGISLDSPSTDYVLSQANTMAIMGGKVGIGTVSPSAKLHVDVPDYVSATHDSSPVPSLIVGYNSQALGHSCTAIGDSVIAGKDDGDGTFSGHYSVAMGYSTTASGRFSTAMGGYNTASGWYSTAIGVSTTASGNYSTAMGSYTTASGTRSTAMGFYTEANGYSSTAMGTKINVDGNYSFGISLDSPSIDYELTQANTMAIMGGNVGIGTVTPTEVLEVSGNAKISGSISEGGTLLSAKYAPIDIETGKWDDGTTSGDIHYSSGKVGIGTNDPDDTLEIEGNLKVTNSGKPFFRAWNTGTSFDSNIVNIGYHSPTQSIYEPCMLKVYNTGDPRPEPHVRLYSTSQYWANIKGPSISFVLDYEVSDNNVTKSIYQMANLENDFVISTLSSESNTGSRNTFFRHDYSQNSLYLSCPTVIEAGLTSYGNITASGNITGTDIKAKSFQNNPTIILNNGNEDVGSELSHIVAPSGGSYRGGATETGAIKITLPHSWTSTMMYMKVRIYEYDGAGPGQNSQNVIYGNNSVELHIAGYTYGGSPSAWMQTTSFLHKSGMSMKNVDYNVRYGHDGSKCCIFIGETNTTWNYPQVIVTDATFGYTGYDTEDWSTGWDVSFVTTLATNIDATIFTGKRVNLFKDLSIKDTGSGTVITYAKSGYNDPNYGAVDHVVSGFENFKTSPYIYYEKLEFYSQNGLETILIEDLMDHNPTAGATAGSSGTWNVSGNFKIRYEDESGDDDFYWLYFNGNDLVFNQYAAGSNTQYRVYRIDVVKS